MTEMAHLACARCRYSGAAVGHSYYLEAGQECPYCRRGRIVEWVPRAIAEGAIVKTRRAIDELGARLRRTTSYVEDLRAQRDDYKDRWEILSRVAKRKIDRLEAQLRATEVH